MSHPPLDPTHAVYAGSFDPVTLGHWDIIQRGARLFRKLTVGIGFNPHKQALFTPEERVALLKETTAGQANVDVQAFQGLTVEFMRRVGAAVLVRGMRTVSDIETEFTITLANRALAPDIETVFLMASIGFTHISSSLIKQVATLGSELREQQLGEFVPTCVIAPLMAKVHS